MMGHHAGGHGASGEVFVLGAGFSKAMHDGMPLLDELGDDCGREVRGDQLANRLMPERFSGGRFETWLSRLAEDQPDLNDIRNAENRAVFLRVSEAIHTVIERNQRTALGATPAPEWLFDLVSKWHNRLASVITFNYDNLIEIAVNSLVGVGRTALVDARDGGKQIYGEDLIERQPMLAGPTPTYRDFDRNLASTFHLLKLHGSLDWYWEQGDQSGATIARVPLKGVFGAPVFAPTAGTPRHAWIPGRVPFIVPPAAAKSAYYHNPFTKSLWQYAAQVLQSASQVMLIGFSLPLTDLIFTGAFTESLNPDATIGIVDRNVDAVVGRLNELGIESSRITQKWNGSNCVSEFVNDYGN